MYTILEADLLSQSVMLTQPSDEIWALNSLRGMHRLFYYKMLLWVIAAFLMLYGCRQTSYMNISSFICNFFAYFFLSYSDYGFSQPCSCSCGNLSRLLSSEPKEDFKNICRKSSLEYSVFVFMDAVTWHLFKRRKRKEAFSLSHICVYFRENFNAHIS